MKKRMHSMTFVSCQKVNLRPCSMSKFSLFFCILSEQQPGSFSFVSFACVMTMGEVENWDNSTIQHYAKPTFTSAFVLSVFLLNQLPLIAEKTVTSCLDWACPVLPLHGAVFKTKKKRCMKPLNLSLIIPLNWLLWSLFCTVHHTRNRPEHKTHQNWTVPLFDWSCTQPLANRHWGTQSIGPSSDVITNISPLAPSAEIWTLSHTHVSSVYWLWQHSSSTSCLGLGSIQI